MISPKGMDNCFGARSSKMFLIKKKMLEMTSKVWGYDEVQLFKITKLNFCGKAKDWFKIL